MSTIRPNPIRLLEGDVAGDLANAGRVLDDRLGTARAVLDAPDEVAAAHAAHLRAGASIVATLTADTVRWRMLRSGEGERWAEANRNACAAANVARDGARPDASVAGTLPPLRGPYITEAVPDAATLEAEYAEHALILAPDVDVFFARPLSTLREAVAALRAAAAADRPCLVGLALADDGSRLRSGEAVADAARALAGLPLEALLLEDAPPEAIGRALPQLARVAAALNVPFGGAANAYHEIPPDFGTGTNRAELIVRTDLDADAYCRQVGAWIDLGATIIGGCGGIGSGHIARLALATTLGPRP